MLFNRPENLQNFPFPLGMSTRELMAIIDELIPARNVTVRSRPSDLWFDQDCRSEKRSLRRLERSARAAAKCIDVDEAMSTDDQWSRNVEPIAHL